LQTTGINVPVFYATLAVVAHIDESARNNYAVTILRPDSVGLPSYSAVCRWKLKWVTHQYHAHDAKQCANCALERYHLSFLLVTIECIDKIQPGIEHISRYNTAAAWTKCNGLVADNVAHAAGASIL